MRWHAAVIACTVLATLVAVGGAGAQGGKVVVYSALDTPVTNAVLQAFEQTSGLRTEALTLAAAGELATRLRVEKAQPQADIFLGRSIDFHAPLANDGLLDAYISPRLAAAKLAREFYNAGGDWYGWYIGALAILYNRDPLQREMAPRGLQPPAPGDGPPTPAVKHRVARTDP